MRDLFLLPLVIQVEDGINIVVGAGSNAKRGHSFLFVRMYDC